MGELVETTTGVNISIGIETFKRGITMFLMKPSAF
jgi:hypothetical protein